MDKKIKYPAIFLEEDDGITVIFPDLPGCITCADTQEEAYEMAKEAMILYLEDYTTSLPRPSNPKLSSLQKNQHIVWIEAIYH